MRAGAPRPSPCAGGWAGLASSRGPLAGCTGAELLLYAPGCAVNLRAGRSRAPVCMSPYALPGTPRYLARLAGRGLLVHGVPRPGCCCSPLGGALLKCERVGPGRQSELLRRGAVAAGCLPGAELLTAQRGRCMHAELVVLRCTPGVVGAGEFVRWPRGWACAYIHSAVAKLSLGAWRGAG